jgi:23S rRNA pseudoU1915 N3-methylase RlmH
MARNRVIYQSEAIYASKDATSTGTGDHESLERVQSANYSFNISRQDVNQFGQLGKVGSMVLEAPTVSMDTSYLLTDGFNERALGFYVQNGAGSSGSFISGHLNDGSGRNFYILTVGEGSDATGLSGTVTDDVIGIGNAYLTDYTLDLAVGSLPTVSVSFEAANINASVGGLISGTSGHSNIALPSVSQAAGTPLDGFVKLPPVSSGVSSLIALRPGDIKVNIANMDDTTFVDLAPDFGGDSAHIQSASLSIPLSRSPLQRLGTKYSYARAVDFPIQATLSVNAIVNELTARNLSTIIDNESGYTITLTLNNEEGTKAIEYTIKGAQIQSESFSSSIGSNKSVDLTFVTSVGGPNDLLNGVFVSGANTSALYA